MSSENKYSRTPKNQHEDIENLLIDGINKTFCISNLIDSREYDIPNPRLVFEEEERIRIQKEKLEKEIEIQRKIREEQLRIEREEEIQRQKEMELEKESVNNEDDRIYKLMYEERERKRRIGKFWGAVGVFVLIISILGIGLLISTLSQ